MDTENQFRLFVSNVRSLQAHFEELLLMLDSLNSEQLDMIALTETWVNAEQFACHQINGYTQYLQNRHGRKSGGVAVYIRAGLVYEVEEVVATTFNALKIKFKTSGREALDFSIIAIYRFCTASKLQFVCELEKCVESCSGPALLAGDFNIDLLSLDSSARLLNLLTPNGFRSLVNEPTRVGYGSSTCLDHVYLRGIQSDCSRVSASCRVVPVSYSDHSAIFAEVSGLHRAHLVA